MKSKILSTIFDIPKGECLTEKCSTVSHKTTLTAARVDSEGYTSHDSRRRKYTDPVNRRKFAEEVAAKKRKAAQEEEPKPNKRATRSSTP